ncbi:MAG: polyphosphate polymerase domain-containing protein [Oscillospiraceae bacterium]
MKIFRDCNSPETESAFRHEIKYGVTSSRALSIKAALSPMLLCDAHTNSDGGYLVKTLYFDTPDRSDYCDKELGANVRQKLRLRTYGNSSEIFRLEMKRKENDVSAKYSCLLDARDARALASGDYSSLRESAESNADMLYAFLTMRGYRPLAVVTYYRYAYHAADRGFRMTFDTELRYDSDPCGLFRPTAFTGLAGDSAVIEVKYGDFLPEWITRELLQSGISAGEFSKYGISCARIFDLLF